MIDLAPDMLIAAGRFRLVREIGRGGMGTVWLGHHVELDIPCAVKFIEGEAARNEELRARFAREARAVAKIRSAHVVQIYDHGIWDDRPFIAMELLEGEDLGARLDRVGRLRPAECAAILAQAASGLARAHAKGIIHRDLKPENLFLVRDVDGETVKLLDFGIAKVDGMAVRDGITKTGALMGTPYYMSPEQVLGTKEVDSRSDLWALGVIAYQSLTGRRPFSSDGLGELMVTILNAPLPVPSEVAPDLPRGFDRFWQRAAARDPQQRFQTAKELSDALAMSLGISIGGAVETSGELSSPSLVGRAMLPSGIGLGRTMGGASAEVAPGTVERSRSRAPRIAAILAGAIAGVIGIAVMATRPAASPALGAAGSSLPVVSSSTPPSIAQSAAPSAASPLAPPPPVVAPVVSEAPAEPPSPHGARPQAGGKRGPAPTAAPKHNFGI